LINNILIVSAVIFGVLILALHNGYEKNRIVEIKPKADI
jgi:hypothetical protein